MEATPWIDDVKGHGSGAYRVEIDAQILIVDDQPTVRACLEQILLMSGFRVLAARDGEEALTILRAHDVDLILADIMMPNMDGYQLFEQLVENPDWVQIPFIYLTARVLDSEIRFGKELGVDDYLVKPVEARNLLAVVRGKLRRAHQVEQTSAQAQQLTPGQPESTAGILCLGRLELEVGEYRVWFDKQPVELSNTEFLLLECLAKQANKVVPLPELIEATHGLDTSYREASNLLRPMLRSIRRKLGYDAGNLGCIESVRGVGYRLVPPT
jgi:DNA-binding response OmpR family regulator